MRPAARPARREQVPRDATTAITVRNLPHTVFDYPWHYHPEVELTLIVNGCGVRYVGDSIEEFGPGEVALVGGATPHCWLARTGGERTDWTVVVQFPPDVFGQDFLHLAAAQPIAALLTRAAHGLVFEGATRQEVAREMWRLTDPTLGGLEKLTCLLSILATLASCRDSRALSLTSGHGTASTKETTRAGRVLNHLHAHVAERISQREVAALVGMSPGTFSRFFTRHFGKPFVGYVAELRVGNACRLLLEQDLGISEIAYRVGFNNIANFNRHFLKLKGMTPSAYRKLARPSP